MSSEELRDHWQRQQEEMKAGMIRKAIRSVGIPAKDLALLAAGKLEDTPAVIALRESAAMMIVTLSGGTGCGKTTAGSWWLWSFIHDERNWNSHNSIQPVLSKKAPVFITAARLARMSKFDEDETDKLLLASRLVLDDLGAEYLDAKGAFLSVLDEVINERYAARRPTVIATNVQAAEFTGRYGERIVDRIREAGTFVSLSNASLRPRT